MNYGEKGRKEGFDYEDLVESKFGSGSDIDLTKKILGIHGKKTTSKTDKILSNGHRASIKNPKTKSTSIQIQIIPLNSFISKFPSIPGSIYNSLVCFFGVDDTNDFVVACDKIGVDYNSISAEEQRRNRLDSFSLGEMREKEVVDWFYQNRYSVAKMAFVDGLLFDTEIDRKPTHLYWANKKNNLDNIQVVNVIDLLNIFCNLDPNDVYFRKSNGKGAKKNCGTVIQIGPLTLQMKGSGEGASYHSMQFNASLNDLEKYIRPTLS